jgi:C4-dicarboxylate-binding protein DctP
MKICNKKVVAISLAFFLFLNGQVFGSPKTLRIGIQVPLEHHLAKNIVLFKEEVERKSNGLVKVKIHDYSSIKEEKEKEKNKLSVTEEKLKFFKDKEMISAVDNGFIEAGIVSLTRFSDTIPAVDIFSQPFLFDTEKKLATALKKDSLIRTAIEDEINKTGKTVLWWQTYGNVIMISNSKGIQNPDDIKGKRVRVFGKTQGNLVLVTDGFPYLVSNSMQYYSYKYKKTDAGMTTIVDLAEQKLWEVLDTISITNHANIQFIVVINTAWLNSLNKELRSIIFDAAIKAEISAEGSFKKLETEAYMAVLENGMKISVLSDDDREFWKEKSSPLYKKYLDEAGETGQLIFDNANKY